MWAFFVFRLFKHIYIKKNMLTGREIIIEYMQCLKDPVYAIETYLETFDKTQEGFVPFKLFYRQKEIVKAYKDERFNIITKPRQAGVSTTTAAFLAIQVAFGDKDNPEAILILANKQDMAQEFLSKVKDFLLQLPRWVWGAEYYGSVAKESKSIFLTESKKELMLPNRCRVKAVATSKDALRGYTPTYLVMDEAAFIDNGVEVFGAALTALGCVKKDSLILTENGLVTMDELVTEKDDLGFTDLEIPHQVCNRYGQIVDATQTFVSEYGETYKIKTKSGLELEGSWKHPLLINNGESDWVKMFNLEIGDKVTIGYNQNLFGNVTFPFEYQSHPNEKLVNIPIDLNDNLDFSYLLGLFVAEGNFQSRGICITNVDTQITDFLLNDGAKLGSPFKQRDDKHYEFSSTKLVKWFEAFGLKKHNAKEKEIPLPILKMSKSVIAAFLQGMFDGDGCSTYKEIKYSSTSKKLITTLQVLLLNFGIKSTIRYEEQKTSESSIITNKNHVCKIFNLFIYSKDAIRFYNEIGFRLDRKQINKENLLNKVDNSRYINVSKPEILSVLDRHGVSKNKVRFLERFFYSKYDRITYHSYKKLVDYIGYDEFLNTLEEQIEYNENFYTDEIVSIEKSEGYTYDLHVPETNSFISNGLISHNTGGRATLISTPNGQDPLYYETYEQAKVKKNNFNVIEMHWYEDPRYNKDLRWYKSITNSDDPKADKVEIMQQEVEFTNESYIKMVGDGWKPRSFWYEQMCMGMNNNTRMIAQELDVSFLGSGGNVIADEDIEHQEKFNVREPKWVSGEDEEFWIWEEPIVGHEYILGCLPPNEKVLTNKGLLNIQDVEITDKLISETGELVNIINKQIYPVIDEDIYEMQMDNTFRTTTFTKEHPILISKPNLKRNYIKNHDKYNFNERYWEFDFNYIRMEEVMVGDWVKVPNIYKKNQLTNLDDKWLISDDIRGDLEIDSPLTNKDFWWFIGMWLGDGWLGHYKKDSYSISICFDKSHHSYVEKCKGIINKLFKRSPSFIDKGTTYELIFNSKFLYKFLLENFGQYSYGKKISEWVKYIPNNYKTELIRGYFDSDGCWVKHNKGGKVNSKISFVSINLELLESVQDIIFSLGVISSLNKLRGPKITEICGRICQQKEAYNLTLSNNDSLELIKLIYDKDDIKLNKFDIDDFLIKNKRGIQSCHFDENKDYIHFKVKGVNKSKFSGNVYNFECDTHTFMCHHITTHNCDVARGDGADASTIVIIDATTMEEVMEYQGKIQPDLLALIVEEYGNLYDAYVVVDITGGMGVTTVLKLIEFDYKKLHYDDRGKLLGRKQDLDAYVKEGSKIPGFSANGVRLPMISHMEYMIRMDQIKIRSRRMTGEMRTFIYRNGRPDHSEGKHDDLLMALGMALWTLEHSFKKLAKLENKTKAMLSAWVMVNDSVETEENNRNGFVSRANKGKKVTEKPNFTDAVKKNMQDPNGDHMWLFSGMK
jgi:intein/homing endonuclease